MKMKIKNKILVSILIVNYNGKDVLKMLLESTNKMNFKGEVEVIVVDNNSTDGSQKFIKRNHRNIKLVQNKGNFGYCGINKGLIKCNGKYVFFTNNDAYLDRNCLSKLFEALEEDKTIGIASPKVVNYFNKNLKSCGTWVSRSFYNGHFKCSKDSRKEIPYNGIAMIRKDIIDKFGYLFDESYFIYAEDLDLGLRARLLGYKVVHIPEAVLYHMHSITMSRSRKYKLTYAMERNLLTTFIKILSLKNIIIFLPYVVAMRIAAILKDVSTLKIADGAARVAAMASVIIKMPSILKKRSAIQRLREKNDSFLLEVFSEKYLFSSRKITV